jgi:hypothetical protein
MGPPADPSSHEGGTIAARGRGEMGNAPALGAGARKSLRVRLPPPAPEFTCFDGSFDDHLSFTVLRLLR